MGLSDVSSGQIEFMRLGQECHRTFVSFGVCDIRICDVELSCFRQE